MDVLTSVVFIVPATNRQAYGMHAAGHSHSRPPTTDGMVDMADDMAVVQHQPSPPQPFCSSFQLQTMINKVETLIGRLGSSDVTCSPEVLRTLASTGEPSTLPVDEDDEDSPDTLSLEEAVPGPLPSLDDMTAVVAYVECFCCCCCCCWMG